MLFFGEAGLFFLNSYEKAQTSCAKGRIICPQFESRFLFFFGANLRFDSLCVFLVGFFVFGLTMP